MNQWKLTVGTDGWESVSLKDTVKLNFNTMKMAAHTSTGLATLRSTFTRWSTWQTVEGSNYPLA